MGTTSTTTMKFFLTLIAVLGLTSSVFAVSSFSFLILEVIDGAAAAALVWFGWSLANI